ncbi:MAG: glycosyltransferase [Candidatus Pacebacteria bacterium CG10_big_fil_rev_8_21_14_0_10_44_54]|nr:MAG: glycosyltransferase [Candidatus Pacebacteria bacterium CG10_big_fil_rev_8_21_14_0_10_44_54]
MPKISQKNKTAFCIVTPSFNQAQFLEQTIKSVLDQSGDFDLHYFVADGGSTDASKKILEKYADKLNFVSEPDAGQTNAINKGIAYFSKLEPEYAQIIFAYINSDDYYLPDAFALVSSYFSQHKKAQWLVGDAAIVDENNKQIQSFVQIYKKVLRQLYVPQLLSILNPIPQPATFVRWEAIDQVGTFDESLKFTMDYDYWQRLQQKFGRPHFLPQTLAAFRIHSSSKGGSQFTQQFAEELAVAKRYTTNQVLLFLHKAHIFVITAIYRMIK